MSLRFMARRSWREGMVLVLPHNCSNSDASSEKSWIMSLPEGFLPSATLPEAGKGATHLELLFEPLMHISNQKISRRVQVRL